MERIEDLEKKIWDLKKDLIGVQKDQAALRLRPCKGDSEIREKDARFDELDRRLVIIKESIRDLTRKRQLLICESTRKRSLESLRS
jgi:hypothetical protein